MAYIVMAYKVTAGSRGDTAATSGTAANRARPFTLEHARPLRHSARPARALRTILTKSVTKTSNVPHSSMLGLFAA